MTGPNGIIEIGPNRVLEIGRSAVGNYIVAQDVKTLELFAVFKFVSTGNRMVAKNPGLDSLGFQRQMEDALRHACQVCGVSPLIERYVAPQGDEKEIMGWLLTNDLMDIL